MPKKILGRTNQKKEKSKMESPQEVKVGFEPERLIFSVGGKEFFLSRGDAVLLFGEEIKREFEAAGFANLRTLQNLVTISRLLKKGLGYSQISQAMGYPTEQITKFFSHENSRPRVETFDPNCFESERQRQAEGMDFCREADREPTLAEQKDGKIEFGQIFIDLAQVRSLQKQGKKDKEIASFFGVDREGFENWMKKNQQYLNLLP